MRTLCFGFSPQKRAICAKACMSWCGSLVLAAASQLHVSAEAVNNTSTGSPWCLNASALAKPGMYGDMGDIDLLGPRGKYGQYIDVPDDKTVAQLWQQGIAHLFGFNNVEALRSLSSAAYLDPECALCHWGVAMCYAPNIKWGV
jgi:hypothetical protein